MKYLWLISKRIIRKFFNGLSFKLSAFLLVFSGLLCFAVLLPECFDKVPAFSYLISNQEFPMKYELHGNVRIYDDDNKQIDGNVDIFIGGYNLSTSSSTEFNLAFTSPSTNEIYAVIRYEINGEIDEKIECIEIVDYSHVIEKEFEIWLTSSSMVS